MVSLQCLSEVKFCNMFFHTLPVFPCCLMLLALEKGKVKLNVALCAPYELVVLACNRLEYEEHLVNSGKGAVLILLVINNRMCGWCKFNFAYTYNIYLHCPHFHLICLTPILP